MIFDTLIRESKPEEVEAVLGKTVVFQTYRVYMKLIEHPFLVAHELGHWYHLHPSKMMIISQLHIFTILALFPAFLHAPPVLRSFDFSASVSKNPPTIVAFLIFQVGLFVTSTGRPS